MVVENNVEPQDLVAVVVNRICLKYLIKTKRIMLGRSIDTKLIRMTADHLNQKEQIVLNKWALLSCELEDLLK